MTVYCVFDDGPIEGEIVDINTVPNGSWPDGVPRRAALITVATSQRCPEVAGDDGRRTLRLSGGHLTTVMREAIYGADAPHLVVGGWLRVGITETGLEVLYRKPDKPQFDSPMEKLFWDACRVSGHVAFQEMECQHAIGRFRLDFAFPAVRLGIEIDGFDYHSSRNQLISDRRRQREIERLGWRLIRFAGSEVKRDPAQCVAEVVAAFAAAQGEATS